MALPEQDKNKIDNLLEWFRASEESSWDARRRWERNLGYYSGYGHWTRADIEKAAPKKDPLITVNKIFKFLNILSGNERQSRQDVKAFPVGRGADPMVADIFSAAIKYVDSEAFAMYAKSDMFMQGHIADRAYLRWKLRFNKVWPEVRLEAIDPRYVYEEPDGREYDLSDHRMIAYSQWLWEDVLVKQFADNEDEAQFIRQRIDASGIRDDRTFFQTYKNKRLVRVMEFQYKESQKYVMAWRPETRELIPDVKTMQEVIELVNAGFHVINDVRDETYICKLSGDVMLESMPHPFLQGTNGMFDITKFSPYYAMGTDTSMVDQLTSQQDELNANRSAARTLVAKAPKGTVIWTKQSGLSQEQVDAMSALGGNFQVHDLDQLKVIDASAYLSALSAMAQLSQAADNEFQSITGLTDVVLGNLKSATSGVVFERALSQAVVGLEMGVDNYRRSVKLHYKKLIPLLQKFFPSDRLFRITDDQYPFLRETGASFARMNGGGVMGGQTPAEIELLDQYQRTIERITVDPTVGEYDLILEFGRTAVSQMNYNLSIALEMIQRVPNLAAEIPDLIIDMANFPNKALWLERLGAYRNRLLQETGMQQQMDAEQQASNQAAQETDAALKQASVLKMLSEMGNGRNN